MEVDQFISVFQYIENPTASHCIDTIFSSKTRIRLTLIKIRATKNSKTITRKSFITCALIVSNIIIAICIHATIMILCQTFVCIWAFTIITLRGGNIRYLACTDDSATLSWIYRCPTFLSVPDNGNCPISFVAVYAFTFEGANSINAICHNVTVVYRGSTLIVIDTFTVHVTYVSIRTNTTFWNRCY